MHVYSLGDDVVDIGNLHPFISSELSPQLLWPSQRQFFWMQCWLEHWNWSDWQPECRNDTTLVFIILSTVDLSIVTRWWRRGGGWRKDRCWMVIRESVFILEFCCFTFNYYLMGWLYDHSHSHLSYLHNRLHHCISGSCRRRLSGCCKLHDVRVGRLKSNNMNIL